MHFPIQGSRIQQFSCLPVVSKPPTLPALKHTMFPTVLTCSLATIFALTLAAPASVCPASFSCDFIHSEKRYPQKTQACVATISDPGAVASPSGGCCYYCSNALTACSRDEAERQTANGVLTATLARDDLAAVTARACQGEWPKGVKVQEYSEWFPRKAGANSAAATQGGKVAAGVDPCSRCRIDFPALSPEQSDCMINCGTSAASRQVLGDLRPQAFHRLVSERQKDSKCSLCTAGGGKTVGEAGSAGSGCLGMSTNLDSVPWTARASQAGLPLMMHPLEEHMIRRVLCWEADAENRLCATPDHIVALDSGHETMLSLCRRVGCSEGKEEVGNFWAENHDEEICGSRFCVTQKVDGGVHRVLDGVKEYSYGGVGLIASNLVWKALRLLHL